MTLRSGSATVMLTLLIVFNSSIFLSLRINQSANRKHDREDNKHPLMSILVRVHKSFLLFDSTRLFLMQY